MIDTIFHQYSRSRLQVMFVLPANQGLLSKGRERKAKCMRGLLEWIPGSLFNLFFSGISSLQLR